MFEGWTLSDFSHLATVVGLPVGVVALIIAIFSLCIAIYIFRKEMKHFSEQMKIIIAQKRIDNLCVNAKEAYDAAREVELAAIEAAPTITCGNPKRQADALNKMVSPLRRFIHTLYLLKKEQGVMPELDLFEKILEEIVFGKFDDGSNMPVNVRLIHALSNLCSENRETMEHDFEAIARIKKILLNLYTIQPYK